MMKVYILSLLFLSCFGAKSPSEAPQNLPKEGKKMNKEDNEAGKGRCTCFAKIRVAMTLNNEFRQQFDHLVKTSRLDLMDQLVRNQINSLCVNSGADDALLYMDSKKEAVELVEDVILKMNNDEKDRLNVWNNLNDTDSEEKFFRAKIQSLPPKALKIVKKGYIDILGQLFNATLPSYHKEALTSLTERDFAQLRAFAKEGQIHAIKDFISKRTADLHISNHQRSELSEYFANAFQSISLSNKFGTRQYQLQKGSQ